MNACIICNKKENVKPLLQLKGNKYANGRYFDFLRCSNCQLVFLNPEFDYNAIEAFYPPDYKPHDPDTLPSKRRGNAAMAALREHIFDSEKPTAIKRFFARLYNKLSYRSIPLSSKKGKLLDIGCGVGSYLMLVRELGWEAYGVEPNEKAVLYATTHNELNVTRGGFENAEFPENFFDVVTMWHSLEHLIDPKKALQRIRKLLNENGRLMIGVPNFSSWNRSIFKDHWNGFEVPLHLYHFNPESIRHLSAAAGFECETIVHTIRPGDMLKSVENLLANRFDTRFRRAVKTLTYIFLTPVAVFFSMVNRSSIIKIYAKKNPIYPKGSISN